MAMSEAHEIIARFQHGAEAEYTQSGGIWPKVCIMGFHDYEAMQGLLEALKAKCGSVVQFQSHDCKTALKAKANRTMMFQGVRIFTSYANETGMVFGGPERK